MSKVRWVDATDIYDHDGAYVSRTPVIPLSDLNDVVEGLKRIQAFALSVEYAPLEILRVTISIRDEARRLLAQLAPEGE